MFAKLVTQEDSDLKVVNAARISFDKQKTEFYLVDARLIEYLAKNKHWTPFAHCRETMVNMVSPSQHKYILENMREGVVLDFDLDAAKASLYWWAEAFRRNIFLDLHKLQRLHAHMSRLYPHSWRALVGGLHEKPALDIASLDYGTEDLRFKDYTVHIKAPIFVARQMFKHKVGFVENEISRRYVDTEPEFFMPDFWRERAMDKKQGSKDTPCRDDDIIKWSIKRQNEDHVALYKHLLAHNVCPEQARMVLPQSMYTEWWVTGSSEDFNRIFSQRIKPDAQKETRELAKMIKGAITSVDD